MAININTGFHVGSATPIDDRAYLSKAEMLAVNENIYPDYFLAVCSEDGGLYVYDKSAVPSAETGKFVPLSVDANDASSIQVAELPTASDAELGKVYQYVGADETTYTKGFWYVCTQNLDTLAYEWTQLNVQPDTNITLEIADTATEGYLKTYVLKQNDAEVGTIDIPKDLVVTSGTIETITYDADTASYSDGIGAYTDADVADEASDFYGYPIEAGSFLKLVIANQALPVFVNVKDMVGDGLGDLTEEMVSTVEVGGINVGDVLAAGTTFTEFVQKLLIKYYPPSVSLNATPGNKIVENGETVNVELSATVTRNSDDIVAITFYKGGDVLEEVASVDPDGGVYTHTVADAITTNTTFKCVVSDGTETAEGTVKYTFVNPYYTGSFADGSVVTLDSMTKKVEAQGTKTYTYTVNNEIIVFAQPAEYSALTSIIDGNGFENIDSFDIDDSSISGYRIYYTNKPVTCTNFKYTFK